MLKQQESNSANHSITGLEISPISTVSIALQGPILHGKGRFKELISEANLKKYTKTVVYPGLEYGFSSYTTALNNLHSVHNVSFAISLELQKIHQQNIEKRSEMVVSKHLTHFCYSTIPFHITDGVHA